MNPLIILNLKKRIVPSMTRRHRSFRKCGCSRIDWADGQNGKMNGHKVENC
jgi:hypothetical protein